MDVCLGLRKGTQFMGQSSAGHPQINIPIDCQVNTETCAHLGDAS